MTPFHVLTIGSTTILIIYFFVDTSNRDIATQIDKRLRKEHGSFSNAFTGKAGGQPLICRSFVGLPNYSWHMFLCAIAFVLDAVNYSVRCWQASECTLGDESACVFKNSGGERRCCLAKHRTHPTHLQCFLIGGLLFLDLFW
jgi:hypothetical protein